MELFNVLCATDTMPDRAVCPMVNISSPNPQILLVAPCPVALHFEVDLRCSNTQYVNFCVSQHIVLTETHELFWYLF
jgi:hypothetical protein